ncbi:MAG: protein translocase subunit SecD [bacterium]
MKQTYYWLLGIVVLAILAASAVILIKVNLGLDIQGGARIVLRAKTETLSVNDKKNWPAMRSQLASEILPRRVSGTLGVTEAPVHTKGDNQFVVELPGYTNILEAEGLLQQTARLEFRWLKNVQTDKDKTRRYIIQHGDDQSNETISFVDTSNNRLIKPDGETQKEYEELIANPDFAEVIVTGADLKPESRVSSGGGNSGGQAVVQLRFNPKGEEAFGNFVSETSHFKEYLAIVLDKKIISAPVNNITGRSGASSPIIEGNFNSKSAAQLASLLNAGALPVDLEIVQSSTIEPTLGQKALMMILKAGLIAAAVIMVGMAIYYLLPGLLACIALLLYVLFCYAAFKLMGVTFSLAGIAGFILSIGMAVDANILIFERMKEELRNGKTLMASIDAGFKRAFTAIFDSNFCTLITCAVLFTYGTDVVKGFATTLGVGVLISLFTAITVTRTLLYLLVGRGVAQNPRFFGLGRQIAGKSHFDFVGKRWIWIAFSLLIIIPGLFYMSKGGIKKNIEFEGGTEITYVLSEPVKGTSEQIKSKLRENSKPVDVDNVQLADNGKQLILKFRLKKKDTARLGQDTALLTQALITNEIIKVVPPQVSKFTYSLPTPLTLTADQVKAKLSEAGLTADNVGLTLGNKEVSITSSSFKETPDVIATTIGQSIPEFSKGKVTQVIFTLPKAMSQKPDLVVSELKVQNIYVEDVKLSPTNSSELTVVGKNLNAALGAMTPAITNVTVAPNVDNIGGIIREEMVKNAILSVILACFFILIFVTIRFAIEGGWSGFRYGAAAIIATLHDVLIMMGSAAIFGYFFGWEISALFITALLTMIGFSVHDTIVIFDRIRENLKLRLRGDSFDGLVNRSIVQSFARSILTSLTVAITVFILFMYGSVTTDLKHFHMVLLIGVISGAYSSIFNAAQILVIWEHWRARGANTAKVVVDKPMVSTDTRKTSGTPSTNRPAPSTKPKAVSSETTTTEGSEEDNDNRPSSKAPKRKRRM